MKIQFINCWKQIQGEYYLNVMRIAYAKPNSFDENSYLFVVFFNFGISISFIP